MPLWSRNFRSESWRNLDIGEFPVQDGHLRATPGENGAFRRFSAARPLFGVVKEPN